MKVAVFLVLCMFLAAQASERTGNPGYNGSALVRGTYTVEDSYAVGLSSAYGLAIQDDVTNSIWISQYTPVLNNEFDMSTGSPTGNTWAISSGVDPDDMGYCEYASSPNQFFFGDWAGSLIAVYDVSTTGADPYFSGNLAGPAGWQAVCGVGAGHDNIYASDFFADEIAWGPYTGTETSVTWTTASFATVSGMSVWEDYLFVCCQITGADNIFIFALEPDGSVNMTPVWSCVFTESSSSAGGVDYDGEYLWVYPQNDNLYKLDIDWTPSALQNETWGAIKSQF
ncbi:MAG: hypothetical protein AVO35_09730 [Candidatus Aegiribacteria sp. MLS_C]|nr:MAG: hypothetical protein AVO35_09730 [Candidatus Aegiribacteria sp. MLS_C]